jgi:amidase
VSSHLEQAIPFRNILSSGRTSNGTSFFIPLCNSMKTKDATISELQRFRTSEKVTSQALVACYLAQIKQLILTLPLSSLYNPLADHLSHLHSIINGNFDAAPLPQPLKSNARTTAPETQCTGRDPFLVNDKFYTNNLHNTSEGGLFLLSGHCAHETTVAFKIRALGEFF